MISGMCICVSVPRVIKVPSMSAQEISGRESSTVFLVLVGGGGVISAMSSVKEKRWSFIDCPMSSSANLSVLILCEMLK